MICELLHGDNGDSIKKKETGGLMKLLSFKVALPFADVLQ